MKLSIKLSFARRFVWCYVSNLFTDYGIFLTFSKFFGFVSNWASVYHFCNKSTLIFNLFQMKTKMILYCISAESWSSAGFGFPFVLLLTLQVRLWVFKTALPKIHTSKLLMYSLSVLALSKTKHCFLSERRRSPLYNRPPS